MMKKMKTKRRSVSSQFAQSFIIVKIRPFIMTMMLLNIRRYMVTLIMFSHNWANLYRTKKFSWRISITRIKLQVISARNLKRRTEYEAREWMRVISTTFHGFHKFQKLLIRRSETILLKYLRIKMAQSFFKNPSMAKSLLQWLTISLAKSQFKRIMLKKTSKVHRTSRKTKPETIYIEWVNKQREAPCPNTHASF